MKLTTKRKEQISSVLIICLGNILNAFSARVFLLPADLVAGGTTGIGLILPGKQAQQRAFSAPAAATEQDAFSVRNFQIDVMQPTMFLPRIGKRYIFKLNQPITPPRTHNSKIR